MTESLSSTEGVTRGQRTLRAAIWAGVTCLAALFSTAALGGQLAYRTAANQNFYQQLELIDRGKNGNFVRPTPADPREEIACLALNIYFEARSEPDTGKLAVAHVVMNRVLSRRFPGTICKVVQQGGHLPLNRCQFSWWCDGLSDMPWSKCDWERSSELALSVYWGMSRDPTDGALWYHADYVAPSWRNDFERGPKIGRHIFYREADRSPQVVSRLIEN